MKTTRIKLKIGEFSKLNFVTVKTLRHYEQIGLLIPNQVDEWTRYRYYDVSQMQKMNRILYLKELGFSLEEIREIFDEYAGQPPLELIRFKEVPAVPTAACANHYGSYEALPEALAKLYAYIEENGYRLAGSPRFSQIDGIWNKDSEEEWLTEIQVPVER